MVKKPLLLKKMPSRAKDWLKQANRDLQHAKHSLENGEYEWACFASQQAAEKALKAVYQKLNAEAWGHSVKELLEKLPSDINFTQEILDKAKILDKYYIPARYPNSFDKGAPMDYFTKAEAQIAIEYASEILNFCVVFLSDG